MANFRASAHSGLKNTKSHKSNTRKNTREQKKTSHRSFVYGKTLPIPPLIAFLFPHVPTT